MRGGYQIIDLKGVNHTPAVGMVHDDIYDIVEGTTKPILLTNIVVDDKEYKDAFVTVDINESAFVIKIYGYTITINSNDVVTFTI